MMNRPGSSVITRCTVNPIAGMNRARTNAAVLFSTRRQFDQGGQREIEGKQDVNSRCPGWESIISWVGEESECREEANVSLSSRSVSCHMLRGRKGEGTVNSYIGFTFVDERAYAISRKYKRGRIYENANLALPPFP